MNNPIRAEAESIVETYNEAKEDHAPPLSWFGMTSLRDGDEVSEGFVFDVDGYLDRDGWDAVRWHNRAIESVEARDEVDGDYDILSASLSVIIARQGEPIPEGERCSPDEIDAPEVDGDE